MSIRDSLLRALDGKPGQAVSGEHLAHKLGVSRTAIWKQIKILQHIGLPVKSTGRQGYFLKTPFDSSLISYRGPSWVKPHYQMSISSTQYLAKSGGAAGLQEGHLWISEMQTKGRGRLDRRWDSGYGGLWFSLLLRPDLSPLRAAPITLFAGLCLRQAIFKVFKVQAKLKWPNDVMVVSGRSFKKLAGILTEMSGQMDRTDWLVIGVGVNVNNSLPHDLSELATTLNALTGKVAARSNLLDAFLASFHAGYHRFCDQGFAPFCAEYWKHYYAPGKPTSLKTADGLVTGKAIGVDASGAIMIESRRKIRTFNEGEIVS
jgi:BirA family biotin operon repressor/biotin-[acetyl-CoA-carboxylase] ligase